jgi:hypothetical protein
MLCGAPWFHPLVLPALRNRVLQFQFDCPSDGPALAPAHLGRYGPGMSTQAPRWLAVSRVERLVERSMTVPGRGVRRRPGVSGLAWLAQDEHPALDEACDVCLSYIAIDLGIRGRAIGLLARVLHSDLPPDPGAERGVAGIAGGRSQPMHGRPS